MSGKSDLSKSELVYYVFTSLTSHCSCALVYSYRDGSTAVIENTDTEDMHGFVLPYTSTKKTPTDNNIPMTAASRFALNQRAVNKVDAVTRIIPSPFKIVPFADAKSFVVDGVNLVNLEPLGTLLKGAFDLLSKLGVSSSGNHQVSFVIGDLPNDINDSIEAYSLGITALGTTITAAGAVGLFNGLMSFIGLLDIKNNSMMTLKEMTVHDKPRFEYRGHQVDSARNFRSKDTIMKTIDVMALYKVS